MVHTGHCLCGAVALSISADPVGTRQCWCRLCQHIAAGNATVNVLFPTEAIQTDGEVQWYESVADSGNTMRRGFCPKCGTPLFSYTDARPHITVVRAGVLDDRSAGAPQAAIWTSEAPEWARIDPDLPQFSQQPPPTPTPPK